MDIGRQLHYVLILHCIVGPCILANVNSFTFAICRRPSVCRRLSVCLSSVTFVHPTQPIEIFGNVSTPFGTLAICEPSVKILRRCPRGTPSSGRGGG